MGKSNRNQHEREKSAERQVLQDRTQEIEDRLANKDISPETFNTIMTRYQVNLMNLNADIEALNTRDDSIAEYIDDGLNMLLYQNKLFLGADYDDKRIIAGALFSGKIILANDGVRNTGTNEVADYFARKNKGLGGFKKVQAAKNSSLYGSVQGKITLSNQINTYLAKIDNLKYLEMKPTFHPSTPSPI